MRRLLVYGLLSCVLVLLLYALLHSGTRDDAETPLGPDEERGAAGASSLLTSSGAKPGGTGGPGLASRVPPEAPSNEDERGPVTVRVVGRDGQGLSGVFVGLTDSAKDLRWTRFLSMPPVRAVLEADGGGEVVYRDLPYDGSVSVMVFSMDPRATDGDAVGVIPAFGLSTFGVPVRGAQVRFPAAYGLWLHVHEVEAETGRRVAHARSTVKAASAEPLEVLPGRQPVLVLLPVEDKTGLGISVQPPEGRLAWDEATWRVQISPYAKRLEVYYPLRREVGVSVTVLEPDGSPTLKPEVYDVRAAGRNITASRRASDGLGRLRITGVPFLPGEALTVRARRRGGYAHATVTARIPAEAGVDLFLEVTLPPEPQNALGIGGGAGGSFRGRGGSRNLITSGGSHVRPKGAVVVLVRRRDGTPAQGARVYLGKRETRTDLKGRAHFPRVHPGEYAVRVKQVGLLPLSGKVTVRGEAQARLVLREGPGGRLEVCVVDDEGRPLAYARLQVKTASGQPWIDLQDGVQRVDPFTDHEGRRVLHGIEPGTISILATWGSRKRRVQVPAEPGQSRPVEIVLAP